MELVKINHEEYGLEKSKANELMGNLPQIISERSELEKQFNHIIKLDISDPDTTKQARDLRLLIQKNRTKGIIVWHKTSKDYFLKGGQFVDAIKRKEVAVNERMESDLEEIQNHAEILEQKRLKELQDSRVEELSPYVEDAHERQLSAMDDDVWVAYFATKKKEHEDRIAAEKQAEADRIAKEKAEAVERERIRKENEKLKAEAEKQRIQAEKEAAERAKAEAERQAKAEAERKAQAEKERKEREAHEAAIAKERAERQRIEKELQAKAEAERKAKAEKERKEREAHEAAIAKERAERQRIEKELEAKAEAERKAQAAAEAAKQAELNKGDADKVNDLIAELNALKTKYKFQSKKNQKMYSDVGLLIDKVTSFITK